MLTAIRSSHVARLRPSTRAETHVSPASQNFCDASARMLVSTCFSNHRCGRQKAVFRLIKCSSSPRQSLRCQSTYPLCHSCLFCSAVHSAPRPSPACATTATLSLLSAILFPFRIWSVNVSLPALVTRDQSVSGPRTSTTTSFRRPRSRTPSAMNSMSSNLAQLSSH